MSKRKSISLVLCLSALLMSPVSVLASDWGLDIDSANDAFGEMAGEFEKQRSNYGNIEIYNKGDIYDRYNSEIKSNKAVMDADKKLADFKNHKYEGYGTISELNEKLSNQYKKGAEDNKDNFADKLKESKEKDDFISSIKDDLSEKKEENKSESPKSTKASEQQARYQSIKQSFASVIDTKSGSETKINKPDLLSYEDLFKNLPSAPQSSNESEAGKEQSGISEESKVFNDYMEIRDKYQSNLPGKKLDKDDEGVSPVWQIVNQGSNSIATGKSIVHNLKK